MTASQTKAPTSKRWRVKPEPPVLPAGEWPALIGTLLAHRGVRTTDEARAFFDTTAATGLFALPDLDRAVERLTRACHSGETVAVFGDFDVDGVTAAALLTEGLRSLGAQPIPYLPHRVNEGYGLNTTAIGSLRALGATLLVTADCGTSSVQEIAFARGQGMDVVVLDHHTVPPQLPIGVAIVNPKRPDGRPSGRDPATKEEPAACGIAYYVLVALHDALGRAPDEASMLELVALGTVCDLAPLVGENRSLVQRGLQAIARTRRPGLRALLDIAGGDAARVDTETVGFGLGPRLNAAGRLAHARLAFDLLTCGDEDEAQRLATELDSLNRQRQRATETALALAEELMAEEGEPPLIMIGHEEFPSGIVGLIAARLADSRHRPAIAYERGAQTSRASARSIPEFDVTAALRTCPELFERFGGHRMAAGFTAKNENLPAIKERLIAHAAEELRGLELTPGIDIDAELPLSALRGEEIRWLRRMSPYGVGNPEPAFLSCNVLVAERRAVGQDGRHLRLKLRDGALIWPAIAFRQEGEGIDEGAHIDIVYSISADRRTSDALELRVLDMRLAVTA
ncbi:MAG: single-stranded-DNA-specific exonuclease RecJ [Dehalococcoidia bacterium]